MGDVRQIIAVTGTRREGGVLAGLSTTVIAGGGDAAFLQAELAHAAKSAAGIISFGMAGALDPALRIGDWVIGTSLAGSWEGECDRKWAKALVARLPGATLGCCYADGRLIADPVEKQTIGQNTGALAADMESHIAARAAADAGVPFAILRCISDEAEVALPPAIGVAMRPGGGLSVGAILASILKDAGQVPGLSVYWHQSRQRPNDLENPTVKTEHQRHQRIAMYEFRRP